MKLYHYSVDSYQGAKQLTNDYKNNYVDQQYLPYELKGEKFYRPSFNGYEQKIADHMKKIKKEAEE